MTSTSTSDPTLTRTETYMNTTTTSTAIAQSSTWPKIALRWMPTFLGFPIGGEAAKLIVGHVDGVGPAIAGGAISGIALGTAQWLGMRRTGPSPLLWILATTAGFAVGLAAGAGAVDYRTNIGSLATQGAICGAIVGVAQATVLYRLLGRIVVAWPAALAALWALGWTITTAAGIDVEAQYTVFGSSGAIVVTAATSILPILLAKRDGSLTAG
jgi:hypothetical protein